MSDEGSAEGMGPEETMGPAEDEGPTGRPKGGFARASRLTPEERSEIARRGAQGRWAPVQRLPVVVKDFKGVLNLGGMKLPCAVIEGPNGIQRVLTENGITNAILGSRSGYSKRAKKAAEEEGGLLPLFLAPAQLQPFIREVFPDGPLMPIDYVDGETVIQGYDHTILPGACDVWLKARAAGVLQAQQKAKAQHAEILMRALAHVGIVALIDEVTGYEVIPYETALVDNSPATPEEEAWLASLVSAGR